MEAPVLISKMPHVMAAVVPPVAVMDINRELEEGPRLAPITMPEDAGMELAMESLAPALEDREIESLAPTLEVKSVGEEVESLVQFF